jgi:hypothetical protein
MEKLYDSKAEKYSWWITSGHIHMNTAVEGEE